MTDIGRVGIVMKGDYNSAYTYETLDAVTYSNALYVAKQNVPAGTTPPNATYWQSAIDYSGIYAKPRVANLSFASDYPFDYCASVLSKLAASSYENNVEYAGTITWSAHNYGAYQIIKISDSLGIGWATLGTDMHICWPQTGNLIERKLQLTD